MSLKIKLIFSSILFSLGILLTISLSFYIIISKLWREQDYELLENQAEHFSKLYQEGSLDAQFIEESQMVLVFDSTKNSKFIHYPKKADSDEIEFLQSLDLDFLLQTGIKTVILNDLKEEQDSFDRIENYILTFLLKNRFLILASLFDDDFFEIYTQKISEYELVVVGKFSEDREEALSDLRYIAGQLILPCLLVTVILSWLMARIFLNPILEFVEVIKRIRSGEKSLRPTLSSDHDELDLLKKEFSSLMDKNDALINSLKDTLDNVAHDLRTPLTHFRMNSELALTQKFSEKDLKEALSDGIEASDYILRLLKSLMDIQEIESGIFYLKKESFDLQSLISEVLDMFSFTAEEKGIKFELSLSPVTIYADRLRIFQIITNLIDNAIKYSPENKHIFITLQTQENMAKIVIEDQGIGISESDLPKIWDRLYRADTSRTAKGAGIGLSLVKAYIMAHQGSIEAHSRLAYGSQFIISLPIGNEMVRNS